MIKGEKIRFEIHNILYSIYKLNKNLNNQYIKLKIEKNRSDDISLLNTVTLNSMRYSLHTTKIINKYVKKKLRDHQKILLQSAITQIIYLNFKEYAVVNCSVEIAKKLKIHPGFINAVLKKIIKNKKILKDTKISFKDLPEWFKLNTKFFTKYEKDIFLKNFAKEPDIHLVFKDKIKFQKFEEKLIKTSDYSGFLAEKKYIKEIKSYNEGYWWVQDFSSFFPLYNLPLKYQNGEFLDACAAPGGKSFQLLSKNLKIDLNDISKIRTQTLKSNLKRLKFNAKIFNYDFIKFKETKKYDFIILDSPCSSVGTIRKNPEIFYKTKGPNLKNLISIQKQMLEKAAKLLNKNGLILYMVCSFLQIETRDQIDSFLTRNTNFRIYNFKIKTQNSPYSKLLINNLMLTLPSTVLNMQIDGYFAAYLKKIK